MPRWRPAPYTPVARPGTPRTPPTRFAVRSRPALGFVRVWDDSHGERTWQRQRQVAHKRQDCAICGKSFAPRTTIFWWCQFPSTSKRWRICDRCVTREGAMR